MDKCDYLSMLGLKLIHVSKRNPLSCSLYRAIAVQIEYKKYIRPYIRS